MEVGNQVHGRIILKDFIAGLKVGWWFKRKRGEVTPFMVIIGILGPGYF